jgi:hypothetical protein
MTDDDLKRKFSSNCEPVIGKAKCERLGEIVWNFEQQTDTQELLRVVIPDPRQRK